MRFTPCSRMYGCVEDFVGIVLKVREKNFRI
jgi:hypothetical protein